MQNRLLKSFSPKHGSLGNFVLLCVAYATSLVSYEYKSQKISNMLRATNLFIIISLVELLDNNACDYDTSLGRIAGSIEILRSRNLERIK